MAGAHRDGRMGIRILEKHEELHAIRELTQKKRQTLAEAEAAWDTVRSNMDQVQVERDRLEQEKEALYVSRVFRPATPSLLTRCRSQELRKLAVREIFVKDLEEQRLEQASRIAEIRESSTMTACEGAHAAPIERQLNQERATQGRLERCAGLIVERITSLSALVKSYQANTTQGALKACLLVGEHLISRMRSDPETLRNSLHSETERRNAAERALQRVRMDLVKIEHDIRSLVTSIGEPHSAMLSLYVLRRRPEMQRYVRIS
jgi:hypothetical protein